MAIFTVSRPRDGRAKNLGGMARWFATTEILRLRAQNDTLEGSTGRF